MTSNPPTLSMEPCSTSTWVRAVLSLGVNPCTARNPCGCSSWVLPRMPDVQVGPVQIRYHRLQDNQISMTCSARIIKRHITVMKEIIIEPSSLKPWAQPSFLYTLSVVTFRNELTQSLFRTHSRIFTVPITLQPKIKNSFFASRSLYFEKVEDCMFNNTGLLIQIANKRSDLDSHSVDYFPE